MMNKKLLAAAAILAITNAAQAAQITTPHPWEIAINGTIDLGDFRKFENVVRQIEVPGQQITITLNSPGGNVSAGLDIGRLVNNKKMKTHVDETTECSSICAAIWIAGVPRSATFTSLIGFHAAFDPQTHEEHGQANATLGAYYAKIGLSDEAIRYLTAAGPNEAIYLTREIGGNLRHRAPRRLAA